MRLKFGHFLHENKTEVVYNKIRWSVIIMGSIETDRQNVIREGEVWICLDEVEGREADRVK